MRAIPIRLSMLAAVGLLAARAALAQDAPELQIPELDRGETLEKLGFPATTEKLTGWTKFGKGKVYTLPVKAGQHVRVTFDSKSPYAFMAIFDLASSDDEAFFGTDEDGMSADVTVEADTTWLIKPYYSRVTRRRGLGAPYSILIEPLPAGAPQAEPQPNQLPRQLLFPPRTPAK